MRILALAASGDPHIDRLEAALGRRGAQLVRINVDELPHLQWSLSASDRVSEFVLPEGTTGIDAVYYRRLTAMRAADLWDHIPENRRRFVAEELEAMLRGLGFMLENVPWINPLSERQDSKVAGLLAAKSVGLSVPDTLVSNDPEAVRAFVAAHPGGTIYKPVANGLVAQTCDTWTMVYTERLRPEHLRHPGLIRAAPGTFQEELRGREYRITIIDERIFAAEVISGSDNVDWRREIHGKARYEKVELPNRIESDLLALMKRMDLRYGCIDMIHTGDDRYVFLEVNARGSYLWLEQELGLGITEAIAEAFLRQ